MKAILSKYLATSEPLTGANLLMIEINYHNYSRKMSKALLYCKLSDQILQTFGRDIQSGHSQEGSQVRSVGGDDEEAEDPPDTDQNSA